jgi:hypothetical protein
MTVAELIVELQKFPLDLEVMRQLTAEYGVTEIETVELRNGNVVID